MGRPGPTAGPGPGSAGQTHRQTEPRNGGLRQKVLFVHHRQWRERRSSERLACTTGPQQQLNPAQSEHPARRRRCVFFRNRLGNRWRHSRLRHLAGLAGARHRSSGPGFHATHDIRKKPSNSVSTHKPQSSALQPHTPLYISLPRCCATHSLSAYIYRHLIPRGGPPHSR